MREIKASEFKAKCLKLIDEVNETGEAIVVTKHGKPVVRVEPERGPMGSLLGCLKGEIEILTPDGELPSAWDDGVAKAIEDRLDRLASDLAPVPPKAAGA